MALQWYVVHTYSGFENRAKQNLEERIKNLRKASYFSSILVPTETVAELAKGKKKESKRKIFPGYLLVQMELNEEKQIAAISSVGSWSYILVRESLPDDVAYRLAKTLHSVEASSARSSLRLARPRQRTPSAPRPISI